MAKQYLSFTTIGYDVLILFPQKVDKLVPSETHERAHLDNDALLPYVTHDMCGIGGNIKTVKTDFIVEEIPTYLPSGNGTHTFLWVEKTGIPTTGMIQRICNHLGVPNEQAGYAGLKDAHAVTRQWISIEHIDESKLASLDIKSIKILKISRHENKLKPGHLLGNTFSIKIRDLQTPIDEALCRAKAICDLLSKRGVPNYFGPQRFGNRKDGHLLGRALIAQDYDTFISLYLGRPKEGFEYESLTTARTLFEQGEYRQALKAWPQAYVEQRRTLRQYTRAIERDERHPAKLCTLNIYKSLKRFFISAYQSELFNQILIKRLGNYDKLYDGDIAYKHENGATFAVENASVEQSRCDAFEISPTGSLFGSRASRTTGMPGEIEDAILDAGNRGILDIGNTLKVNVTGARRPLRFNPDISALFTGEDSDGLYLQIDVSLPSGCYATTLLREIIKPK